MNNGENYRIDPDSFPTFLSKSSALGGFSNEHEKIAYQETEQGLKERVKTLESQKQRLEIDLQATHHRFQMEKDLLLNKLSCQDSNEKSLREDIQRLQSKPSKDPSEKLLFLESQVDFLTKENKRLTEQYKIDKENWELKLENLKKGGGKGENQDNAKASMLLAKAEAKIAALTNEVEELKGKNEFQKANYQQRLEYVQGEVSKLKVEEAKYIRELESRNKDNEEVIEQLGKRIREIEEGGRVRKSPEKKVQGIGKVEVKKMEKSLSVSEQLSKSTKSPLMQSPMSRRRVPLSNKRSVSSSKDAESLKSVKKKPPSRDSSTEKPHPAPARVHNKAPSYLRKENQSNNIDLIEQEIAVLTGRYKYLLQMSQEASELQSLKTEITKVATEIESKSNQLFALKKKQKEFLMQQITH